MHQRDITTPGIITTRDGRRIDISFRNMKFYQLASGIALAVLSTPAMQKRCTAWVGASCRLAVLIWPSASSMTY
jgi:hypothetical protein